DRSVWQTAVAATCTIASPRPGSHEARSTISKLRGAFSSAARVTSAARSHDDGDLFYRKVGDDLGAIGMHDQHLLDPDTPLVLLAVLGFEREHHAGLDLERMVERPDA